MRRALVGLVIGVMATSGGTVAAQSPECITGLLTAAIEMASLPPGFAWSSLTVRDGWSGSIEDGDEQTGNVFVGLYCRADAELQMARSAEITEALGLDDKIGAVDIGDGSFATRAPDAMEIELSWRHGDVIGSVSSIGWESTYDPNTGYDPIEIGDLEKIAAALDATLPE